MKQSVFWKNKINKPLAKLNKKKGSRHEIREEKGDIMGSTEIQSHRNYALKLYANKF